MPEDPFTGTWRLNVCASSLPFAPPASLQVCIEASEGGVVMVERSVSQTGAHETVTLRASFDGAIHPVRGSAMVDGYAAWRITDREWKTKAFKGGRLFASATMHLTPDAQSLLEEVETTLADGTRAHATLIFERVPASTAGDQDGPR